MSMLDRIISIFGHSSPSPLPEPNARPSGLHQKYIILHYDGSPIDPEAIYFTLRLDEGCKDKDHVRASREAALAYAEMVVGTPMEQVGRDLVELIEDLENEEYLFQYRENDGPLCQLWGTNKKFNETRREREAKGYKFGDITRITWGVHRCLNS